MKTKTSIKTLVVFLSMSILLITNYHCKNSSSKDKEGIEAETEGEHDKYDGPAMIAQMEYERTIDPTLGRVPRERLINALQETDVAKENATYRLAGYGNWIERGPNSDAIGISNGNTRANNGVTAGRIRAVWIDLNDATQKTAWVGGVDGGIWKTTDITTSPANWIPVNDFFSNMAITGITQSPANKNIMYFCTGEWVYNIDAVRGDGIFKSTDGGATWAQLTNTKSNSNFAYCSKILCDNSGNVFVTTRNGVFRSTDAGLNWTDISPSGYANYDFSDMELSSTGRLHVSAGQISTCAYRYTDNPAAATPTWAAPTSGYPTSSIRIELGCVGNTLYALPANAFYKVPTIYKSTDGGSNWAATSGAPTSDWMGGGTYGQAWYNIGIDVDPSNANIAVVGGLEPYKTTDGGVTWTKLANWYGTSGQYVHADIHFIKIYGTGSSNLLFGSDGGVFFSSDAGTTIRDRNVGLRIKQFYSVAIHPSTTNYFLAGAQDNGSHQLTSAGLGASVEVTGGDGAFVHIDQNEPQYQFTSYVRNNYRRSTDGGATWSQINISSNGQFINPTDYDNSANIMYCANSPGTYLRWTDPQTSSTNASITIPEFNGNSVTAIKVSPYTTNTVYFGTRNDIGSTRICRVDNANTITSGSAGLNISTGLPTNVYTSCIDVGTNDNNLMVCFSNYGVNNVWVTSDGGTSWSAIDGNLPDMPVRWCMFVPGDNTRAIIATETGVWLTQQINGASTVWMASPSFPTVRTDMLQYRPSDKLIAAATHGRGLWTQGLLSVLPLNNFVLRGRLVNATAELNWDFQEADANGKFTIEYSIDGIHYSEGGLINVQSGKENYSFTHRPPASKIFYRVKHVNTSGKIIYTNVVRLFKSNNAEILSISSLYPNPVMNNITLSFANAEKGKVTYMVTNLSGQTVWRKEESLSYSGVNSRTWDMSALKSGAYLFTIYMGNEKTTQKFVKQ